MSELFPEDLFLLSAFIYMLLVSSTGGARDFLLTAERIPVADPYSRLTEVLDI